MIHVLVTRASKSESIHIHNNYLELKQFDSLTDAVEWGLKQYHEIIIIDQKQKNENGKSTDDYWIYKDDIEDRGMEFVEYDYHLIIYDDYIE